MNGSVFFVMTPIRGRYFHNLKVGYMKPCKPTPIYYTTFLNGAKVWQYPKVLSILKLAQYHSRCSFMMIVSTFSRVTVIHYSLWPKFATIIENEKVYCLCYEMYSIVTDDKNITIYNLQCPMVTKEWPGAWDPTTLILCPNSKKGRIYRSTDFCKNSAWTILWYNGFLLARSVKTEIKLSKFTSEWNVLLIKFWKLCIKIKRARASRYCSAWLQIVNSQVIHWH